MSKKYTINWQDGDMVSVAVDGVEYASIDDVPDEDDRDQLELLKMGDFGLDMEAPSNDPFTGGISLLFLGVGILLLVIAAISGYLTRQAMAREDIAQGQVIDLEVHRDTDGNDFYYPVVSFDLPGGAQRTVRIPEGSWPPAYQIGEVVQVRYNPEKPQDAHIASFSSNLGRWLVAFITGLLGAIFTIVALVIRRVFSPAEKTLPAQSAIAANGT